MEKEDAGFGKSASERLCEYVELLLKEGNQVEQMNSREELVRRGNTIISSLPPSSSSPPSFTLSFKPKGRDQLISAISQFGEVDQ